MLNNTRREGAGKQAGGQVQVQQSEAARRVEGKWWAAHRTSKSRPLRPLCSGGGGGMHAARRLSQAPPHLCRLM